MAETLSPISSLPTIKHARSWPIVEKITSNQGLLLALAKRGIGGLEQDMIYLPEINLSDGIKQQLEIDSSSLPMILVSRRVRLSPQRRSLAIEPAALIRGKALEAGQQVVSVKFGQILNTEDRWQMLMVGTAVERGRGRFNALIPQKPGVVVNGRESDNFLLGRNNFTGNIDVLAVEVDFRRTGVQSLSLRLFPTILPSGWETGLSTVDHQLKPILI